MYDLYDPNEAPTSSSALIQLANKFDFVHIVIIDLHGIPRVNVYPSDSIESLMTDGATVMVSLLTFMPDGSVVMIPDHQKKNFGNIRIRPIIDTARKWPWWNLETDTSALQIFATSEWLNGVSISADSRRLALIQLKRLHDRGLDVLLGTHCEYRLFKQETGPNGEPLPTHLSFNQFHHPLLRQYQSIYVEINKRIRSLGFKFDVFHNSYGFGQIEFLLTPEWGIKHIDDVVRFKMVAKDVANDCGCRASFMTRPIPNQLGNSFHLDHSIWRRKPGQAGHENIMFDSSDPDKVSLFAKQWLAGLLHHSSALTALTSPTVNCYRRLHTPWAPTFIDWGFENRGVSYCFKNGGTNQTTFLENRCPSSASNPYLSLAATIAAGLDGVDRSLPLIEEGSKEMGSLPHNLSQSLEALKKDEVICSALGEQFIEWFGTAKLDECVKIGSIDTSTDKRSDLQKERDMYFDVV